MVWWIYMSNSFFGFVTLTAALLAANVLAASVVGYLGYQKIQEPVSMVTTSDFYTESVNSSTTIATSSVPDSWQIYENEEHGFSFWYPDNWQKASENNKTDHYEGIVRIHNPTVESEETPYISPVANQIYVSIDADAVCRGSHFDAGEMSGVISGDWEEEFEGFSTRRVCFNEFDWPLVVYVSAYDDDTKNVMDSVLSSFNFFENVSDGEIQ